MYNWSSLLLSAFFVAMSFISSSANEDGSIPYAKEEERNNFDGYQYDNNRYNYNNGGDVIQLSAGTVYFFGGLIVILLLINISCLCYSNCNSTPTKRRNKYSKVGNYETSDDDMQNLKV